MTLERLRRLTLATKMQTVWLGAPLFSLLLPLPSSSLHEYTLAWLIGGVAIGGYCLLNATARSQRVEIGAMMGLLLWLLAFPNSPLVFLLPVCGYFVHAAIRAELVGRDRLPIVSHGFVLFLSGFAMTEDFRNFEGGLHAGATWMTKSVAGDPVCVDLWLYNLWKSFNLIRIMRHLEEIAHRAQVVPAEVAPGPPVADDEHWHS